jgi:hypothetical protein
VGHLGGEGVDLGGDAVVEPVDLACQPGVEAVDLLVEPADVGVHGVQLAPDLVKHRRHDVLEEGVDLLVHAHARHSSTLVLDGQCRD